MTTSTLPFCPPEWARHQTCWTAWPTDVAIWGEDLAAARSAVAAMCRALCAGGERIELLAPADANIGDLAKLPQLRRHALDFGDIWLRDTGPLFIDADHCAIFRFNGWGGKYLFHDDVNLAIRIANTARVTATQYDWVLEGGALDCNGAGVCLTTRQCLLNPNRNPYVTEAAVHAILLNALGINRVLWLDNGLRNDHTDGHVDNLARFVSDRAVVCMTPTTDDPNRDVLHAIARALTQFGLDVHTVPSPGLVTNATGAPMPASYLNFYIGNSAVVVPTYATHSDDAAIAALEPLFPGRSIVGVDCRGLLVGGGALHCITQQQPAPMTDLTSTSSPIRPTPHD